MKPEGFQEREVSVYGGVKISFWSLVIIKNQLRFVEKRNKRAKG